MKNADYVIHHKRRKPNYKTSTLAAIDEQRGRRDNLDGFSVFYIVVLREKTWSYTVL